MTKRNRVGQRVLDSCAMPLAIANNPQQRLSRADPLPMQTPLWRYLSLFVLFSSLFLLGCTRLGSPGIFGVPNVSALC
jgi:hypothetical protein